MGEGEALHSQPACRTTFLLHLFIGLVSVLLQDLPGTYCVPRAVRDTEMNNTSRMPSSSLSFCQQPTLSKVLRVMVCLGGRGTLSSRERPQVADNQR